MLIDARSVPENTRIETDVCVIGAGAAGITLAQEFIGQPFRVCLLESGGLERDEGTQALYQGENIGLPYIPLDGSRLRYFGGSTNHWTGRCRPLEPIDFEARDWLPYSGWPFSRSVLDPFYERAQIICELGPYQYDVGAWDTPERRHLVFASDRVVNLIYQFSPPTRFGEAYRDTLAHANNVSTYIHANVLDIDVSDNLQTATSARVKSLQGNSFTVAAKVFVLAAGGIENPRVLLVSNARQASGLGNQNDLVGRFFMDHPGFKSADYLPSSPTVADASFYSRGQWVRATRVMGCLGLSNDTLREEQLVNVRIDLWPTWTSGVAALGKFSKDLTRRSFGDFITHLREVIADRDAVARAVYWRVARGNVPTGMFNLITVVEPVPNPENRVTLAPERDALAKPRAQLNVRHGALEKRSIRRALEILGQECGRAGLGRVRLTLDDAPDMPTAVGWGAHHIGTTRMHVDPKRGVVDAHCRVHGMSNLFIAGSSVFPTAGCVNPTLTIVALAIRLADYVKDLMA